MNYGEYLALSMVESRIAEEVLLNPLLSTAESPRCAGGGKHGFGARTRPGGRIWKDSDETQQVIAKAIVERIEAWDLAFTEKDLNGVLGVYANDYEDLQKWSLDYVKRAYQWFFERCASVHMTRQIRRWDFSEYAASGKIKVLLYCALTGYAVSDATGRIADPVMRD